MSTPDFTSPSTVIQDLKGHIGEAVILRGWVANKREGKGIVFIILIAINGKMAVVIALILIFRIKLILIILH